MKIVEAVPGRDPIRCGSCIRYLEYTGAIVLFRLLFLSPLALPLSMHAIRPIYTMVKLQQRITP